MLLLFWLSLLGTFAYLVITESGSSANEPETTEEKGSYDS